MGYTDTCDAVHNGGVEFVGSVSNDGMGVVVPDRVGGGASGAAIDAGGSGLICPYADPPYGGSTIGSDGASS